jgi:glycosyltransferase involved in cell wall biosynthesis
MRVWFAVGIEPWFLPPVVEMGHALMAQGHEVRAFYVGDAPKAGDELDFPAQRTPRRRGIWRVVAAADLATVLRRSLAAEWPDLVVACDLVALQAVRSLRRRIGAMGYWAFEIVEPPTSFRLSADAWRASRLSHWIRDCHVVLAPSTSRLHRVTQFARFSTLSLVVPNCRCDRRHSAESVAVAEAHGVSKLRRRLVYAGRVSPTQYVHHIVEALRYLPEDVGLVVAGIAFPEYREQLDEYVQRYNLSERCLLLDRVSRAQTDALVAQATLGFVLYDSAADVGAADPAPNKVGDYATLGVPMVGTRQGYLRYWLEERGLGVCVTEASPKAIAAATCALLDPARLARARASCALAARDDLNMSVHATKLIQLLQETPVRATAGHPLRSREERLARAD